MLFQTPTFLAFFTIFFIVYAATRKRVGLQNLVVMIASYAFYAAWDLRFLSLIIIATAIAFVTGQAASGARVDRRQIAQAEGLVLLGCSVSFLPSIDASWQLYVGCLSTIPLLFIFAFLVNRLPPQNRASLATLVAVIANLAILGVFKYFNFFSDTLVDVAHYFGRPASYVTTRIILPVGISFFTFQKLAYVIDIKRGQTTPERDIIRFGAFVAFFPQLVAGPIERAGHLLQQFRERRYLSSAALLSGASLFLWGMFEKTVVADNLNILTKFPFASPRSATTGQLLVGLLAFTFQILCDFAGYSNMARGLARVLGLDLMINFDIPYISRTPSEFWARWHISLSSWLRDYLYIPLGGNRYGAVFTYRNLFITMLLGGLWHGASWTFVAWGAFQGSILILYRVLKIDKLLARRMSTQIISEFRDILLIIVMFSLTNLGWLLFRARDLGTVEYYLDGMLRLSGVADAQWGTLAFFVAPLLVVSFVQIKVADAEFVSKLAPFWRLNAVLYLAFSIIFLSPRLPSPFIYFDF